MGRCTERQRRGGLGLFACGLAVALAVCASGAAARICDPGRVMVEGDFGSASFAVEVADTDATRSQGLMHRESMPRFSGMLFVYDGPRTATFWMKNTLIPLDMLFADETGLIVNIHENAVPLDETVIFGGTDVRYVLEINGGLAERLGIKAGDVLVHPAIAVDQAAAPCPES